VVLASPWLHGENLIEVEIMTSMPAKIAIDDAIAGVQFLRSLKPGDCAGNLAAWCAAAADGLTEHGDRLLVRGSSWETLRQGASALSTAACLRPAARALVDADRMPATAHGIRTVLHDLATQALVQASARMLPLSSFALELGQRSGRPDEASNDSASASAGLSHIDVLDNIAIYHREHERYYTVYKYERAAELAREANKLKVIADVWRSDRRPLPHLADTDFARPAFGAAGCDDLNPLHAVASIGILFMEGQSEPAELRTLKAKLGALGGGSIQAGEWLAGMMAAAWSRESVLLDERFTDAAQARYRTIATNWTGSLDTILMGGLLVLAVGHLSAIDFAPGAVRARKIESAQTLSLAAAILGLAANLEAMSGVDLSGNDECWTRYRRELHALAAGDR
jgi:hypothetical protein